MSAIAKPIIIDNGTYCTRAGVSGDMEPRLEFPTIVGKGTGGTFIGKHAQQQPGVAISRPIEKRIVTNWDDIEQLWQYAFKELKMSANQAPVLLTEGLHDPKPSREKMVEIMFEKFGAPATFLAYQPILSLYAAGKMQGVVIDSGYSQTSAVPCAEGFALQDLAISMNFGGRDLTKYLGDLTGQSGVSTENLRDMKQKVCNVALDYDKQMQGTAQQQYTLPDGKDINVGNNMYKCTEVFFQPGLMGLDVPGLHQVTFDSIKKCDEKLHKEFFSAIVLAGGNTLFPGLTERLQKEMGVLVPGRVGITAPPTRGISAFIGASILTAMPTFKDLWITKQAYEERGAAVVHTVCL